jgi:hypothetical protein
MTIFDIIGTALLIVALAGTAFMLYIIFQSFGNK